MTTIDQKRKNQNSRQRKSLSAISQSLQSDDSLLNGQAVLALDPNTIEVLPQVRKKLKNIQELADSISANSQQQPIIVRLTGRNQYTLEKGQRRLEACKLLGTKVAAVVNNKHGSAMDLHASQLVENIQRDELEPLEIAEALKRFIDEGWTIRPIAKQLGKNKDYVHKHLALNKLSEDARSLSYDGLVTESVSLKIITQLVELDPSSESGLLAQIREQEGMSRSQLARWYKWAKVAVPKGQSILSYQPGVSDIEPQSLPATKGMAGDNPKSEREEHQGSDRPGKGVGVGTMLDTHQSPGYEEATADTNTAVEESTGKSSEKKPSTPKPEKRDEEQKDLLEHMPQQEGSNGALETEAPKTSPDERALPDEGPVNHEGYQVYRHGQLDLRLSVEGREGSLLTTHLDDDPDIVWVKLDNEEKPQRVSISAITFSCMQPVVER
ncbi:ParB/RepB/Spo0J family partition protein [Halomonas sp. 86]|uniref:ParB/RepB/Spo0J family partition protein n=1 Tax=unclassified Halomonas TaxID=2609666 RepID=UPI0040334ACA